MSVQIQLNGAAVELKADVAAARAISIHFEGFVSAFRKVAAFDFGAAVAVIALSTDLKIAEIESGVFASGLETFIAPLCEHLARLTNGGRAPGPVAPATTENDDDGQ